VIEKSQPKVSIEIGISLLEQIKLVAKPLKLNSRQTTPNIGLTHFPSLLGT
jgi:hypothetical protein